MGEEEPKLGASATHKASGFTGTITMTAKHMRGDTLVMLEGNDGAGRPVEKWCDVRDVAL